MRPVFTASSVRHSSHQIRRGAAEARHLQACLSFAARLRTFYNSSSSVSSSSTQLTTSKVHSALLQSQLLGFRCTQSATTTLGLRILAAFDTGNVLLDLEMVVDTRHDEALATRGTTLHPTQISVRGLVTRLQTIPLECSQNRAHEAQQFGHLWASTSRVRDPENRSAETGLTAVGHTTTVSFNRG